MHPGRYLLCDRRRRRGLVPHLSMRQSRASSTQESPHGSSRKSRRKEKTLVDEKTKETARKDRGQLQRMRKEKNLVEQVGAVDAGLERLAAVDAQD